LSLSPVTWFPSTGGIAYTGGMVVEVTTRPGTVPLAARRSPRFESELAGFVDNPPPPPVPAVRSPAAPEDVVAYAIITAPELAAAFEPLAAARTAAGLPARVFTTDWIETRYEGTRPDGGADRQTRIRNFIIDWYRNHGLTHVLLGGDADGSTSCPECGPPVVPARYLSTEALAGTPIPSDLYYGCLDGTFDGDRDGIYGEPNDGEDGGDVDLLFEVHVGRAPVDTVEEARNF